MEFLIDSLAFLGNFHPVMVHFPLALLPIALLFKFSGRRYLKDAANILLKLTLVTAVLAACMGFLTTKANGFSGEALDSHVYMALMTIAVLCLAVFLPDDFSSQHLSEKNKSSKKVLSKKSYLNFKDADLWFEVLLLFYEKSKKLLAFMMFISVKLLKYISMIVLLPLWLIYLPLRAVYRRLLAEKLNPIFNKIKIKIVFFIEKFKSLLKAISAKVFTASHIKTVSLVLAVFMIGLTGYRGSNMVHGEGHLANHAPEWLKPVLGAQATPDLSQNLDKAYYEKHIQPVLKKNCVKCHSADKAKGNLQLHSFAAISKAPVIDFKSPYSSEILKRLMLARDDPKAMPPVKNAEALPAADIALLIAWINGETLNSKTASAQGNSLPKEYQQIDETLAKIKPEQLNISIPGLTITRLHEGTQLLSVNLQFVNQENIEKAYAAIKPFAEHIVDLDVASRSLSVIDISAIKNMPNLVRLNLSQTSLNDQQLKNISNLKQLRWLNIYGTQVSELAIPVLQEFPLLEKVFWANSLITDKHVELMKRWQG